MEVKSRGKGHKESIPGPGPLVKLPMFWLLEPSKISCMYCTGGTECSSLYVLLLEDQEGWWLPGSRSYSDQSQEHKGWLSGDVMPVFSSSSFCLTLSNLTICGPLFASHHQTCATNYLWVKCLWWFSSCAGGERRVSKELEVCGEGHRLWHRVWQWLSFRWGHMYTHTHTHTHNQQWYS